MLRKSFVCLILLFLPLASQASNICKSYFLDSRELYQKIKSEINLSSTNKAIYHLSSEDLFYLRRANTLIEALDYLKKIWKEQKTTRFGEFSINQITEILLKLSQSELNATGVKHRRDSKRSFLPLPEGGRTMRVTDFIEIDTEGETALNRFARGINSQYGKSVIISPADLFFRNARAMVDSNYLYIGIDAAAKFSIRTGYVFHEIMHMRIDSQEDMASMRMGFSPANVKNSIDKKTLETIGLEYTNWFRQDEIIAYKREILFSLKNILRLIKIGKPAASELKGLFNSVATLLSLSEYSERTLGELDVLSNEIKIQIIKTEDAYLNGRISLTTKKGITAQIDLGDFFYVGRESLKASEIKSVIRGMAVEAYISSREGQMIGKFMAQELEGALKDNPSELYSRLRKIDKDLDSYLIRIKTMSEPKMRLLEVTAHESIVER